MESQFLDQRETCFFVLLLSASGTRTRPEFFEHEHEHEHEHEPSEFKKRLLFQRLLDQYRDGFSPANA